MTKVRIALMVLVGLVLVGCSGRLSTAPERSSADAEARAVAFYRAYYLGQDYGAAWDMALPSAFQGYSDRAQYVARQTELLGGRPITSDGPIEVKTMERAGDYVSLISNRADQVLVWVTPTPDGWKVKRFEWYEGGEVPW